MSDISKITCCPQCGSNMRLEGKDLVCDCGYVLEFSENFFKISGREECPSCAKYYTREYYESSDYDYTSYRIGRIIGFARPAKNRRILDIGCGPGEIAARCAKMGADVFGIDVSKDALRLGGERCAREGVQVHLLEFDGERVPFRDCSFDSILLSDVVEHVGDETLDSLIKECERLLMHDGRLIIHTSPARNIIELARILKTISFGRINLYSKLVDPSYEFLHIRYHTKFSLKTFLEKHSLHAIIWGEFRYLEGSKLAMLFDGLGLTDRFSDQLWCVASKNAKFSELSRSVKPRITLIRPPSNIVLGSCEEIFISHGFYDSECDSFRWTRKRAGLFIEVPENPLKVEIRLSTSNPDVRDKPVRVKLYLDGRLISAFHLDGWEVQTLSFDISKKAKAGVAEFEIEVDRTFVPKELGISDDSRELGVAIYRVSISRISKNTSKS